MKCSGSSMLHRRMSWYLNASGTLVKVKINKESPQEYSVLGIVHMGYTNNDNKQTDTIDSWLSVVIKDRLPMK